MKTKLFIDFDDTLFDRNPFREKMFQVLKKYGFTDQEIENSYRKVYRDGYEGIFAHMEFLHKNVRTFDLSGAKKEMKEFLGHSKKFLFPEAIPFLNLIDRSKFDVRLITVGGIAFQKAKVIQSGISKLVDKCHFGSLEKAKLLKKLVGKNEYFILLDDKERELTSVSKAFAKAKVIKIKNGKLLVQYGTLDLPLDDQINE